MDILASAQMVITAAIGQRLDLQTQLLRQTEFGWVEVAPSAGAVRSSPPPP
jgi:hypothetical protein